MCSSNEHQMIFGLIKNELKEDVKNEFLGDILLYPLSFTFLVLLIGPFYRGFLQIRFHTNKHVFQLLLNCNKH